MEASFPAVAVPSLDTLGDHELVHIFSRLPLDERLRASSVSRRFRGLLSSSAQLWKTVSFEACLATSPSPPWSACAASRATS